MFDWFSAEPPDFIVYEKRSTGRPPSQEKKINIVSTKLPLGQPQNTCVPFEDLYQMTPLSI